MTVTADPQAPAIICPSWCVVPREEHLAELPDMDGVLVHWSSERLAGKGCNVRIASTTYVDGTPDPTEPTHLFIEDDHFADGADLDIAQQFGEGIIAAVREAKNSLSPATAGRRTSDCPSWCTFDHGGPIAVEDGDHYNTLADNGLDMVLLASEQHGAAKVQIWLGGNESYSFPLNTESVTHLRTAARVINDAADALEQVMSA